MAILSSVLVIESLEGPLGKDVAQQAEKIPLRQFPGPIDQEWHRAGGLHIAEIGPHLIEQSERLATILYRKGHFRIFRDGRSRRRQTRQQARHLLNRQIEKHVLPDVYSRRFGMRGDQYPQRLGERFSEHLLGLADQKERRARGLRPT